MADVTPHEHYDAIIIGSGFGGSVMAYRLAEAGLKVCVFERGKAYSPGDFPRTSYEMRKNFWDPSEGLYGLFHLWWFREVAAITASGLGGGSLVYANVLLRKEEDYFLTEDTREDYKLWHLDRADLDPHYDRVEKMLGATPYPFDRYPYSQTSRTQALLDAAKTLDCEHQWFLPNLAVTFAEAGEEPKPNQCLGRHPMHDKPRYTCNLCGECFIGCNYGSKNTLDYNYLFEAKQCGAEIKTLSEVRSFKPLEKGYEVLYVQHQPDYQDKKLNTQDKKVLPLHSVIADRVILAAGTFGSTYLLLKMKAAGYLPHLSQKLGTRFSGNGDLLKFVGQAKEKQGDQLSSRLIENHYGPVITSGIKFPDRSNLDSNLKFLIEDLGYPQFVDWILLTANTPRLLGKVVSLLRYFLGKVLKGEPETDISAELNMLFSTVDVSSSTLPMLGIGHDTPDGQMRLSRNQQKLQLDWEKRLSRPYFQQVKGAMEAIATQGLDGKLRNPLGYLGRPVTGHPLGGCPMGNSEQEGVVNLDGEVFHYPGLYVADGSVMPGPIGVNPSLTIAALADRFADRIIAKHQSR